MVINEKLFPYRIFGTRIPRPEDVLYLKKVITWRPNQLSYVLTSMENQILYGKEIRNQAQLPYEIFLDTVFQKDAVLTARAIHTILLAGTSDFTIIPTQLMKDKRLLDISRTLVHEEIYEEELILANISGTEASSLFVIPEDIKYLWDKYLDEFETQHLISTHFHLVEFIAKNLTDFVIVHILEGYAITTAVKNGQVLLANAFIYRSNNDLFYFLLSVKFVLDLPSQIPFFVLGDIEKGDIFMKKLREKLPHTQVYEGWSTFIAPYLEETATWRYGFMAFAGALS